VLNRTRMIEQNLAKPKSSLGMDCSPAQQFENGEVKDEIDRVGLRLLWMRKMVKLSVDLG
jgi:hypothetical protein